MPFVLHLLKNAKVQKALGPKKARPLLRAAQSLQEAYNLMTSVPYLGPIDAEKLGGLFKRCFAASKKAGIGMIPKFHLLKHWGMVAARAGNPLDYNCYIDEDKNRAIVKVAIASSDPHRISENIIIRESLVEQHFQGRPFAGP